MNKAVNRLANLLLLVLGVFSQIYLFLDTIELPGGDSLPFWLLGICLFLWIAAGFRRGLFIGMPLSAALLYAAYRFYASKPTEEFNELLDRVRLIFYTYDKAPDVGPAYSFVILLLAFLLASVLTAALNSRGARGFLSLLGTLPLFCTCLTVNGEPPVWPIFAMLLFWALLRLGAGSYRIDQHFGRTVLITALPILLLMLGILSFWNPSSYHYSDKDKAFSSQIDTLARQISRYIHGDTSAFEGDGNAARQTEQAPQVTAAPVFQSSWLDLNGGMDLSRSYDDSCNEQEILELLSDQSGKVYLRAISFGDYTGTGWAPAGPAPGSSLAFTARSITASGRARDHSADFRMRSQLRQRCLPYYTLAGTVEDAGFAAGEPEYSVNYLSYPGELSGLSVPESVREAELEYRLYAHDVYTRLPASTLESALAYCSESGIRADDPDLIALVARTVQEAGAYDLETGSYPSDDYAIYFLNTARRGYCVHFATAAAVLYRSLGVPARVTEGFLAEAKAGRTVTVTGAEAHAWVEVYLDALGWIPVEVTGFVGNEPQSDPTAEPEAESTPSPAEPEPEAPEPTVPQTPAPEQEPDLPIGIVDHPQPEESSSVWLWLLILPAVLLGLCLLILLRYLLLRWLYLARIGQRKSRRAVIVMYEYAGQMERFGAEMPEVLRQCAEKAAFSRRPVSEEETALCRAILQQLAEDTYQSQSKFRRLWFRFLLGLI